MFANAGNSLRFEDLPLETQRMISLVYMEPSEVEYFAAKVDITKVIDQILPFYNELVEERTILQKLYNGIEIAKRIQSYKDEQEIEAIRRASREIRRESYENAKLSGAMFSECLDNIRSTLITVSRGNIKKFVLWDAAASMMELPFYNDSLEDDDPASHEQHVAGTLSKEEAQKLRSLPKRERSRIALIQGRVSIFDCWAQTIDYRPPRKDDTISPRPICNQNPFFMISNC